MGAFLDGFDDTTCKRGRRNFDLSVFHRLNERNGNFSKLLCGNFYLLGRFFTSHTEPPLNSILGNVNNKTMTMSSLRLDHHRKLKIWWKRFDCVVAGSCQSSGSVYVHTLNARHRVFHLFKARGGNDWWIQRLPHIFIGKPFQITFSFWKPHKVWPTKQTIGNMVSSI